MTKKQPVNDLLRRHAALDKTMRKFAKKPLVLGTSDCGILIHFHLRAMGHKLPPIRKYDNEIGAIRALKQLGGDTLEQVMDALKLERIAPAAMLMGDVGLVPQDPDAAVDVGGALVISVGRKWLGWHPDAEGLVVIDPSVERPFLAAWRA